MSDPTSGARVAVGDLKPKMELKGVVKRIELAGAMVDIGAEHDALLHISQIQPGNVRNVQDALSEGQDLTVWVRSIENGRVAVTMFKPLAVDWKDLREGQVYTGRVVRLEKFGAFVDIGAERSGLVHVSEMDDDYVASPADKVKIDDEIQVKVISVNRKKGKIDLSMKALMTIEDTVDDEPEGESMTAMAMALKKAMGGEPAASGALDAAHEPALDRRRAQQADILKRTLANQIKQ